MAELNQNKVTTIRLTRFCVKTLFYLGNKSHTTQLLRRILRNSFSKKTCEKGTKLVGCL